MKKDHAPAYQTLQTKNNCDDKVFRQSAHYAEYEANLNTPSCVCIRRSPFADVTSKTTIFEVVVASVCFITLWICVSLVLHLENYMWLQRKAKSFRIIFLCFGKGKGRR